MQDIARATLQREKIYWSKPHPFGFVAKPLTPHHDHDDLRKWKVGVPGKEGTYWEHGFYRLYMSFGKLYPLFPPQCCFIRPPYHPNISLYGTFELPILTYGQEWDQNVNIETILLAIQDMIHNPDFSKPMQPQPILEWYESVKPFPPNM